VNRLRHAAITRLTALSVRRFGIDALPMTVHRRRIYIVPSRFGLSLALLLVAMLIAGLNYNSNLGLAFGFLMMSLALVAMHHCHRNLLGLRVDATPEADALAGEQARFVFTLHNDAAVDRCDIEILCAATARRGRAPAAGAGGAQGSVPARSRAQVALDLPVAERGVLRLERFELRTRYPFGWFRAWTYVQSPLTVYVAPAPQGARMLPPAAAAASGAAAWSELRGDEDFAGLRAYQAGVPLKHMAWKVLARGGEAAIRSYTGPAAEPEWLDWEALDGLGPEARLAQLCRWILDSDAAHRSYGLRLPGTVIAPAAGREQRMRCLRALARHPP
jgi:uncharacterized protein (DUF58 family)